MTRTPLALSVVALAALAGCATEHKVASAPAPVVVNPAPAAVVVPPTAQPARAARATMERASGVRVMAYLLPSVWVARRSKPHSPVSVRNPRSADSRVVI
jgi:hypothetical protein